MPRTVTEPGSTVLEAGSSELAAIERASAANFVAATVIGPVSMTVTNSPVLVFKYNESTNSWQLLASGSMSAVDPDKIVLKKIMLYGNPIRVRKRTAVVRHMFYDPVDVKWFQPAELTTLMGLRGHIRESVGTHGLFKALFSGPITQNDQVHLVLYKRVFPKIPQWEDLPYGKQVQSDEQKGALNKGWVPLLM